MQPFSCLNENIFLFLESEWIDKINARFLNKAHFVVD